MSKVLFIGDPHLKITRFDLANKFLAWINETVEKHKPDVVVNLGDTFDTHAVVRSEIMTEFMSHVDVVREVCPYVYVVGNHDMYKPSDSKYHALSHLKNKIRNFVVVDAVQDIYDMTFVPYTHNPDNFPKKSLPICVAHQTFRGADFGDITTKDGVDADTIEGCQLVVSGHIHKRQRLTFQSGVVVNYVGSPFSQSVSDINQVKGVSILDTETFNETFLECPLPMWRGLRYQITPSFSIQDMHDDLVKQLNNRDHWVVEITGPKAEILGYIDSKMYRSAVSGIDVKIKTVFTDREKRQVRIEAASIESILSEYIDKVYSGSIDKSLLKSKISDMLRTDNSSSLV